ncbi:cobalamin biosynthesis protein [Nocardioides sp.]|uniref:cobalamin biosynthesis protein n=1 Tax=Nocardioides sp. TaxID=35761 RepID=UPI00321BF459
MSRALGLALGFAADRLVGDPARFHPVAGFGRTAAWLERRTYADSRLAGAAHVATLVGATVLIGRRGRGTTATALATWAVLGGASLDREAAAVAALLERGDLPGARHRLTHLVGRVTADLDENGVARATIESVAENTSDAVVAALVWGALAGVPGLLGYRATNTLDAMIGHHSDRYEHFGWAAARLDDVLNLPGSRLAALLTVLLGEDRRSAGRAWRHDARAHPSPNAGPVEASFAGALGLRLGGETVYPHRVERRPVLGDGDGPVAADIGRARALAGRVQVGAVVVAVLSALGPTLVRRRRSRPR